MVLMYKLSEDDPFNLLNEYWYYSSNEINKILDNIYNNIKSNMYSPSLYRLIIKKLSCLEAMDYKEPIIKRIVELIRLKVLSGDNIKIDEYELFPDDAASHIYLNYIQPIKDDIKSGSTIKSNIILDEIFENNDWALSFYKYVEQLKLETLTDKKFFSALDYKKIIGKLLNSNIKNVYYFKYSLDHIYGFANLKDYYVSDLDCLKQFKKELNKELKNKNIKDPMLKYPFKILLEKVDNIISVLEA